VKFASCWSGRQKTLSAKNTFRYNEQPAEGQIKCVGALYVQKEALGAPPPQVLLVTITPEDAARPEAN